MNKLEREYGKALTKTLHAYEDLFEDFEGNILKWKDYGYVSHCRLCMVEINPSDPFNCGSCPLHTPKGCGGPRGTGYLRDAIHGYLSGATSAEWVLSEAKFRYSSILKTIRANGWTYK